MSRKSVLLAVLFVGVCVFMAGCKTTEIVGPGGETQAVYSWGKLKATENSGIAAVNTAALKAMDGLGLAVTMKTSDSLSAMIVAHDSQDQKITINMTALAENSTKICIQVSPLGNEEKSRMIYKQIQNSLMPQK